IAMFTWNVATLDPPENDILKDLVWIHTKDSPDMYIVSLQEVSSKPHEVLQSSIWEDPWTTAISNLVCNRGYVLASSCKLQGLVILCYAKMMQLPFFHDIHTDFTRTGLGGIWGNKGAVSVRLDCYGRSFCFVAVHMAPFPHQWEQRDKEYYQIVASQSYPLEYTPHILYHDYIFWLGDLNYRFEDLTAEVVKFLSSPKKLHVLREKDQLLLTIRGKRAFDQFQEGALSFVPTYKYDLGQNTFDSSPKQRVPAWTDRILWRENKVQQSQDGTLLKLEQLTYTSHSDVPWSDHKPVWSDFLVKVSSDVPLPLVAFDPVESWQKNGIHPCVYSVAPGTKTSSWDWIGLYKVGFHTIQRHYCTYVWAVEIRDKEDQKRTRCNVKFSGTFLPSDYSAKYVLCYYSKVMDRVLGVSNVFRVSTNK
ncbi:putative phosphatidylinositol 4,5-bisphosphate 5-phosphatase A, partial [Apostichopus japonicus]